MHGTYSSGKKALVEGVGPSELGTIVGFTSMLVIVIDVEVAETKASFLTVWARNISLNNDPSNCNSNNSPEFGPGLVDFNFYYRYWY